MRGMAPAPGSSFLARRTRSLAWRVVIALVIAGLGWSLLRVGGLPARFTREGLQYLLTKHYDFSALVTRVTGYLNGKPGLDVKVMGPVEEKNGGGLPALPVTGQVARGFGWHPDQKGWPRFYEGVELEVADGALVRSILPGRVARVEGDQALGTVVVIEHPDGRASLYGRLGDTGVKAGQEVAQGQMIGTVAGKYFHFELRQGDRLLDPLVELQHK